MRVPGRDERLKWHTATATLAPAVLLGAVIGLRVYSDFAPARIRIVRSPVPGSHLVLVPQDGRLHALRPPFAAIWRVGHQSRGAERFALLVNGRPVCEKEIAPGANRRIDCAIDRHAWAWAPATPHQVAVSGPPEFTLNYLELATHHGRSTGLLRLYILPRGSDRRGPSLPWLAAAWLMLGLLFVVRPATPQRRFRIAHRIVCAFVIAVCVIAIVSPWMTPYEVVLAPSTWLWFAAVAAIFHLQSAATALLTRIPLARLLPTAWLLLIVCVASFLVTRVVLTANEVDHSGNYSGFVHIESERFDRHPRLRERPDIRATLKLENPGGYDAQFVYFMAFDPWLRMFDDVSIVDRYIDTAPYRYGRTGFVWLTKLVSLDRWQWYPATMVWLVAAGIIGVTVTLVALARHQAVNPAWALIALAVPGLWRSLHYALPEPIAAALGAGALLALSKDRWRLAGALFGAAILVRETVLVAAVVGGAFLWIRRQRGASVRMMLLAVVPYALWRLYVGSMLFPHWGWDAFFLNPAVHDVPLAGMLEAMRSIAGGTYFPEQEILARGSWWFAFLLIAGVALSVAFAWRRLTPASTAAVIYGALALCLGGSQVWSHPANVERTTYELFVMLAFATITLPRGARVLRLSAVAFWIASAAYILYAAYDAEFMRFAIFGLR